MILIGNLIVDPGQIETVEPHGAGISIILRCGRQHLVDATMEDAARKLVLNWDQADVRRPR